MVGVDVIMQKQMVGLVVIGIVVFSVASYGVYIALGGTNPLDNFREKEFEWTVQIGDEFTASINVTEYYWDSQTTYTNYLIDEITFSIIALPELPRFPDGDSFLHDVLTPTKVQCDASTLLENYSTILTDLLSLSIIPTGEWEWLDSLFPDEENRTALSMVSEETEVFTTRIDGTFFQFQRVIAKPFFPNCAFTYYTVWIDMTSGLPNSVQYLYDYRGCTEDIEQTMDVLIEPNN